MVELKNLWKGSCMTTSNDVWKVIAKLEANGQDIFGGSTGETVQTSVNITLDLVNGMSIDDAVKKYTYDW